MALIEMDFAMGNGEHYEETLLWSNSSPDSSFASQSVTLSDNISNYDYLKFEYAYSINAPSDFRSFLVETKNISSYTMLNGYHSFAHAVCGTSNNYYRAFSYSDDTHILFHNCIVQGSTALNNSVCIPTKIIGLKKVGGSGGGDYTYKYVETTISAGSTIIIPTEQKAKGIIACAEDGYVFYATDDISQAYTNGVINTRTSMTFSDNSVNFGVTYATMNYLFRCYYWY